MAQRPFLSVLSVVPPRGGRFILTDTSDSGLPSGSRTRPSSRPRPFQSWARAGAATASAAAATRQPGADIFRFIR
ncbi:MAG: hypothetical protein DMF81_01485 [Acidobacteria bacterium]|nr:MAG: hypothetical protein DMF81_01485 [Acidobacteriota bacterium]